jgi:predicted enzyme related to lactoylglutathione lyase
MPERADYLPGVPCWVDTNQPDPDAAAEFYGGLFGWEFENVIPEAVPGKYFLARIRGLEVGGIGSTPEGAPHAVDWNTYIRVENADETAAKVRDVGGAVIADPFDVADAGRMAVCRDTEGAVFCIWQANRRKGAMIVNEHGSVNFNNLNTRDPEAAKAFYGPVFGWTTLELGPGAEMWTLPGYGDYLERDNPDLRKNTVEAGGPEGFVDVVASIIVLGDDQADVPAHWSIQFGANNADDIAAKAVQLGGTVVAPPMEVPWARITVIRDPGGATFIAAQYKPENAGL